MAQMVGFSSPYADFLILIRQVSRDDNRRVFDDTLGREETDLFRFLVKKANRRRQLPKDFHPPEIETIDPNLLSAMMPFGMGFDTVYETLAKAAETAGLRCRRADDIWENTSIIQDAVSLIDRSRIIICDCTSRNPNVFYEIGIAHTLGRM